jgi:hypothetical protein
MECGIHQKNFTAVKLIKDEIHPPLKLRASFVAN